MRNTKISRQLLEAFETVLSDELNILVCTDEELFILVNDLLPEHLQISYRSYQRYKAQVQGHMKRMLEDQSIPETAEVPIEVEKEEIIKRLYVLLRKACIQQKRSLMKQILACNTGWQRFKWILERKFAEWSVNIHDKEPAPCERYFSNMAYDIYQDRRIAYWGEGWYYIDPIDFDESEIN